MGQWQTISEYPGYEVSHGGEVRNATTGRVLKPQKVNGYHTVTLCDDSGHHQKGVHRLIAGVFVNKPDGCTEVNHIDGNKTNNAASNLEWCTRSANMKHAYETGLQKPIPAQIAQALSKSNEKLRRSVRNVETGAIYASVSECAKKEKITSSAVSQHLLGLTRKRRFEYAD